MSKFITVQYEVNEDTDLKQFFQALEHLVCGTEPSDGSDPTVIFCDSAVNIFQVDPIE